MDNYISAVVSDSTINITHLPRLVSNSAFVYAVNFVFDDSWDDFEKTAVFQSNVGTAEIYLYDSFAIIPWEILNSDTERVSYLKIGVYGISGETVRPTNYSQRLTVLEGVDTGTEKKSTPEIYQQIINAINAGKVRGPQGYIFTPQVTSTEKECILSWTNNGDLDDPEPVDIKGDPGYAPQRGIDYWTEEDEQTMQEYVNAAEREADRAKSEADSANTFKTASETAASNAKVSETNAKLSETKSATSESNALISEQSAKTSETNASSFAANAESSSLSASTFAKSSEDSAKAAAVSELNASNSAVTASNLADNASSSANSASESATAAASSALNANTSENQASIYASQAANNALAAENSATASANSAESIQNSADQINQNKEDTIKLAIKSKTTLSDQLHVSDSADMPVIDLAVQGTTYQASGTGKNLAVINEITDVLNGRYSVDYKIVSNITAGTYTISEIVNTPVNNFALSVGIGDTSFNLDIAATSYTQVSGKVILTFTLTEEKLNANLDKPHLYIRPVRYLQTTTCNYTVTELQIESGDTATEYEPYTNLLPAPAPDNPTPVINAGTHNEEIEKYEVDVIISNSNIYNIDDVINNSTYVHSDITVDNDGFATAMIDAVEGTYLQLFSKANNYIKENTIYTTVLEIKSLNNIAGVFVNSSGIPNGMFTTISPTITTTGTFYFYLKSLDDFRNSVCFLRTTCKIADTAQPASITYRMSVFPYYEGFNIDSWKYTPYKTPQVVTLTSDHELTKWDRLENRDGVWGWSRYGVKLDAASVTWSSNNASTESNRTFYYRLSNNDFPDNSKESGYCNYLPISLRSVTLNPSFVTYYDEQVLFITSSDIAANTPEAAAEWLNSFVEAGNPLVIWYKAKNEVSFEPLPDTEQILLNNLRTYYPNTIICIGDNAEASVRYICDTKLYIDNKFEAINAALTTAYQEGVESVG